MCVFSESFDSFLKETKYQIHNFFICWIILAMDLQIMNVCAGPNPSVFCEKKTTVFIYSDIENLSWSLVCELVSQFVG